MGKISDLFVKLKLKNEDFDKGIDKSQKKVGGFASSLKKFGGILAGAFAVGQIASFAKEVINLTATAEGVERAFKNIGGEDIFDSLKLATKGTVSNLELMKKAISANQLGVPIKTLGKLFEFATARAAETGESVDFLVQSIVTGIGRKSPLILDNLGISAIALKNKMEGVAIGTASVADVAEAVGKIANEELKKMGDTSATAAQRMQELSANWANLKVTIGQSGVVEYIAGVVKQLNHTVWLLSKSGVSRDLDAIFTLINTGSNDAQGRISLLNEELERQSNIRDQLIKKEAAHANLRSKAFQDEKGLFSQDLVNKWAENRIKNNQNYQDSLTITTSLTEDLTKTTKKLGEESIKATEPLEDTINSITAEIEALKKIQGDASKENIANINDEINALDKKRKALVELSNSVVDRSATATGITAESITDVQVSKDEKLTTKGTLGEDIVADQKEKQAQLLANQQSFNQQAAQLAADFVTDTVVVFAEGIGQMLNGDANLADFGKALLKAVGGFLSNLGKMMIQFGATALVYSILAKALSNPVTAGPAAIGMIAAGAALVAIGSAISGAAGGGGSGSGSGPITTIDTRGSGNGSGSTGTQAISQVQGQNMQIEVVGRIDNKVIALSNTQGQKDLKR